MHTLVALGIALSSVVLVHAASASEWRSRSVYQVFTDRFAPASGTKPQTCNTSAEVYCGGTWQGVIDHLDYIQGMGFDSIWISPITAQVPNNTADGEAYHGYWQQDLYNVNSHFGSASDLDALAKAIHSRDMFLMVDVVANHFGWGGPASFIDYSQFVPFANQSYFHSHCLISDYGDAPNTTILDDCWLGDNAASLPDLRTEDPSVQSVYGDWIKGLVTNYSADGLRIDSSLNVDIDFWPDFVKSAGVFATGEVMNGDTGTVCPINKAIGSTLNYPVYYALIRAFESNTGDIGSLVGEINGVKASCTDPTIMGSFSENHDVPRFPSYTSDLSLSQNVIAYTMLNDGIPIIYNGQEQHLAGGDVPANREAIWPTNYNTTAPLYSYITTLNAFRSHAMSTNQNYSLYNSYPIYQDLHTFALRKGYLGSQSVVIFTNDGLDSDNWLLNLTDTQYVGGITLTEVTGCTNLTVAENGNVTVPMTRGLPRVLYPADLLQGSGLCGTRKDPPNLSSGSGGDEKNAASGLHVALSAWVATAVAIGSMI